MLAREVVENAAWRPADPARAFAPRGAGAEVWPVDAVRAARALKGVTGVTGELAVRDLFEGAGEHAPLEQPRIAVGKGDAVVQMLPSALRFWDKLGLTPRGGPKDVVAFVLYEEREPGREEQMGRWLEMVSQLYSGKSFGAHRPGTHKSCSRDGLLPFKFDAIRRTLPPLVGSMNVADSFVVFYVAVPPAYHSLDLPVLRHIFSAMKRAARADGRVLFQLVPEHAIFDALDHHAAKRLHLDALVHSVYDRIQTPVQRTMARAIFKTRDPSWIEIPIEDPAFALARPRNEVVKFVRDAPPRSLDVLDRHTFLHVGYRLSACGRWLLAACVDQRGEAHDVGVWLTPGDNVETQIVSQLWSFAVEFGRRANVEWRLVFCKLGPLGAPELDAWVNHLQNVVPACTELPMVHVTLLCADLDCGWTLLPADARRKPMARASTNDASEGVYVDVSESTYFITQSEVTPILPPPLADSPALLGAQHAFVPDSSLDATGTASAGPPPSPSPSASLLASDELGLLPLATTALLQISPARTTMLSAHRFYSIASSASTCTVPDAQTHEDSTRNWYELSVLARARQQLHAHPALPLHLAALEVMREAFEVAGSPTE
ncbi:hypothetical protein PUNSTDRAFT_142256 [Punctularia strigosozonata HHB-11173 SS5]|uniref:uncharacterized protein n=1 Tax=Punctularia strigosozonata (strain HHB-11173) TaxID=741275 RepID=UPI000441839A|nr:uncharacterized protein PUNSTDRAFT_142256 [Punctularia strigosozonata HHB-11173 SS5]EIN10144.1 hypothetical protein PUNSTDRAFT_142256 [Punctularia strigosozonata HHB-11173 SS5]